LSTFIVALPTHRPPRHEAFPRGLDRLACRPTSRFMLGRQVAASAGSAKRAPAALPLATFGGKLGKVLDPFKQGAEVTFVAGQSFEKRPARRVRGALLRTS
jgi:hypothetical protein